MVADALGDRVKDWATLNEPLCSAWIGHLEGTMAPGLTDLTAAVRASYHLHVGHGLAVQALRAAHSDLRIGIVNNLSPCEPATDREADIAAARRADGHTNRWWLDPIHGRGYPQDMVDLYGVELPVRDGDMESIAAPLDWLGLNYYFRQVIADDPKGAAPYAKQVYLPGVRRTAMDWEVNADGLEQLLVRLSEEYGAQQDLRHGERLRLPRRGRRRRRGARPGAGRSTWRSTWPPVPARSSAVRRWPVTTPGRCWTTSSGRTATTSASAWCTSTTPRRSGPSRAAAGATRT